MGIHIVDSDPLVVERRVWHPPHTEQSWTILILGTLNSLHRKFTGRDWQVCFYVDSEAKFRIAFSKFSKAGLVAADWKALGTGE